MDIGNEYVAFSKPLSYPFNKAIKTVKIQPNPKGKSIA
jgi:hypothetical protein